MTYARNVSGSAGVSAAAMVCVFESAERAEDAIDRLERGGFDAAKLSLIAKESPSALHQVGLAVAGAQARVWGEHAALWRRLSVAAATALVWVPLIGYIVAVGPVALVLITCEWTAHAQGGSPASALGRMLVLAGMSPGEVRTFEAAVRGGQILLLLHAGAAEAARARQLLSKAAANTSH